MDLTDLKCKIFVAASGAGAGIQSKLWAQPGASSYLVGCIFPYSQEQSTKFLGFRPPKFVCREEAIDLAIAAYRQAAAECDAETNPIGLGVTCAVTSNREHRGEHRIHATTISRTQILSAQITLPKDSLNEPSICRYADGRMADQLGMDLLSVITGLPTEQEIEVQDDTEYAHQHFLSRPLFRRDGTRDVEPNELCELYPGAFNPLHEGHLAMVGAERDVIFHITADPPHKPALTLQEMLERSLQFRGVGDVLFTEGDALYLDKARRFPQSVFYMGTDVMERILDPKWGPDPEEMLREFRELGTRLMVRPRGPQEVSDVLQSVPEQYRVMFTTLPRTVHSELSSTQIRAKRAAALPTE
jgi:hypothetical protein